MKIKTKLYLVLASFFCVVVLTGTVGLYAIDRLADESKNILKANYESVEYAAKMQQALDKFEAGDKTALFDFQKNLELQEGNITEIGEKETTMNVRALFEKMKAGNLADSIVKNIRAGVYGISNINLGAIVKKNEEVQHTAEKLKTYLAVLVAVSFVISLVFLISIPGYIANPVNRKDIAKTNFIATISHELKTPISSILMSIKLLEDKRIGGINEEQQGLIRNIKDDSNRLLNITSELLNITQAETGHIQLEFRPTAPMEIINYAVDAIKVQAEQKHVTIEVICPNNLPTVMVDTEKTVWVMVNLLSNAVRYSPENGKVIIEVKVQDKKAVFSVQDFGRGIEDKYKARLFERYFQVPESNRSGTGLGLAISKEFIESQNGSIGIESQAGKGSTFYFELPV